MSILLAIVGLGVLIIVHEAGHFLVARWCGMRVDRFSIGFGPPLARFQRGETTYQIGCIPLGGFVQIAGLNADEQQSAQVDADGRVVREPDPDESRLFPNRPLYQRVLTIAAGPGTNYLFAALWIAGVFMAFGEPVPGKRPIVEELRVGKPAQAAGLQLGDEVLSIDHQPVHQMDDVAKVIEGAGGRKVEIVVSRAGGEKTYAVQPERDGTHWRIGVAIGGHQEWAKVGMGEALVDGLLFPLRATPVILGELYKLVKNPSFQKMSGPIGMIGVLRGEAKRSAADFLATVGSISIGLGLFNLLPFPALDGGRLLFLGYEAVVRRRFPERLEQRIHIAGMLALLGLILIITGYDLVRLFS